MKNTTLTILLTLGFIITSIPAIAASDFTLIYQKKNHWVAQKDATSLRQMLKSAKKLNTKHFSIIIPKENRDTSIERLIILRDILEKKLKYNIILEEVKGEAKANTLVITLDK